MYLTFDEIFTQCELLAEQFPDEVTIDALPEPTNNGLSMPILRVKAGPKAPRHGLYIQANIHGCEWGTADIVMHFVERVLIAFRDGNDLTFGAKTFTRDDVRTALERVEIFIVPCVNPDGRIFSMQGGEPPGDFPHLYWRQNRRDNGDPQCIGVDLNRNFDWIWDFRTKFHPEACVDDQTDYSNCTGYINVTDDVCDSVGRYHGPKPFSEPESRNVRSVLDANEHIRIFVDLHGVMGKVMTPWADDEVQTTDPEQNFTNPVYDGKRGLRDTQSANSDCAGIAPHPDGAAYREFMHAVDQTRYGTYATLQCDTIFEVRGTTYGTGISFIEMYGMSGNANDYAWSRHIANPAKSKIDGFIYEFERPPDPFGFQPPFEDPPGPDDMIHKIHDVAAGLTALLLATDRIPIVECTPASLNFHRVRVGTTKRLDITLSNQGVRAFDIGQVTMLGVAGPFTVTPPSQTHLAPAERATISVDAAPTTAGVQASRVAIEFAFANETVHDVRIVPCRVRGCTVSDDACVAPTFAPAGCFACLGRLIVYGAIIIALALFSWLPSVMCTIKQLMFRIQHCSEGNDNPCREL